jgi:hypothetical protein
LEKANYFIPDIQSSVGMDCSAPANNPTITYTIATCRVGLYLSLELMLKNQIRKMKKKLCTVKEKKTQVGISHRLLQRLLTTMLMMMMFSTTASTTCTPLQPTKVKNGQPLSLSPA